MTLKRSEESALFFVDPPPQSQSVAELAAWAYSTFFKLAQFLARPEWSGAVFARIDSVVAPEFKPEAGLMVYAGPGTLGPQEGLYVYEGTPGAGGAWKKIAGT